MRALACMILKGGSGKTATAVNLAAALGAQGLRVLTVDMDVQRHASIWLGAGGAKAGTFEAICERRPASDLIVDTSAPGVKILPATLALVGADQTLRNMKAGDFRLEIALRAVSEGFDYCVIDTPPAPSPVTVNALNASGAYLIPMQSHMSALFGVKDTIDFAEAVSKARLVGVLPCFFDARLKHTGDVIRILNENRPGDVFTTAIRPNVTIAESFAAFQPVTVFDPKSNGAADYSAAAQEVAKRWDALEAP